MSDLLEYIEGEASAWSQEFMQNYIAQLRRRKVPASGELIRSLAAETTAQFQAAAVHTLISFEQHGRLIDMRSLQPGPAGTGYVAEIMGWLERKGLAAKFIEGYLKKRKLIRRPERILTYIAFGIIKKRQKGKYRRRTTYNRLKTASIYGAGGLYNRIAANMPEQVAAALKAGLAA